MAGGKYTRRRQALARLLIVTLAAEVIPASAAAEVLDAVVWEDLILDEDEWIYEDEDMATSSDASPAWKATASDLVRATAPNASRAALLADEEDALAVITKDDLEVDGDFYSYDLSSLLQERWPKDLTGEEPVTITLHVSVQNTYLWNEIQVLKDSSSGQWESSKQLQPNGSQEETLTITCVPDAQRKMKWVFYQGVNDSWEDYNVNVQAQVISLSVDAAADTEQEDADNILKNGKFIDGSADPWTGGTLTAVEDTDQGGYYLSVQRNAGEFWVGAGQSISGSALTAGKRYKFSMRMRLDGKTPATFTANLEGGGLSENVNFTQYVDTFGEWVTLESIQTVSGKYNPSGGDVWLYIRTDGDAGEFSIDDISLTPVEEDPEDVNIITSEEMQRCFDELTLQTAFPDGAVLESGNISLPDSFGEAAITWSSSDEAIVHAETGVVTLPESGENSTVTLTAEITLWGETARKKFRIPVIPKANQGAFFADSFMIPFVLADGVLLPDSFGEGRIEWQGSSLVDADGTVSALSGTSTAELTAVFTCGDVQASKNFTVKILGEGSVKMAAYTRETISKYGYSGKMAFSMHLAYQNEDGTYEALNNNTGILYAKAVIESNDRIFPMSLKNPYVFAMKDGKYGIVAVRTDSSREDNSKNESQLMRNADDGRSQGSVLLFTTENFIHYQEAGLLKLGEETVSDVSCEYDGARNRYVICWNDIYGNYYRGTTADLMDLDIESTETGAMFYCNSEETGVFGSRERNCFYLPKNMGEKAVSKLSRLENTGVRIQESVTAASAKDVEAVKAQLVYSDGSTAGKSVDWNLDSVDFKTPGTYKVNGQIRQAPCAMVTDEKSFGTFADPCVYYNEKDGCYYFISTSEYGGNWNEALEIRKAETPEELIDAPSTRILAIDGFQENGEEVGYSRENLHAMLWAPEIHEVNGDLYLFFSSNPADGGWDVQSYVMKLKTGGDMTKAEDWEEAHRVANKDGGWLNEVGNGGITLDMTTFAAGGRQYVMWAERNYGTGSGSWVWIATVDPQKPWQLTSDPTLTTVPDYGWDNNEEPVNEGPFALVTKDKVFVTVAGSSVQASYCVALLEADVGADLLDKESWTKWNYPILSHIEVPGESGVGHNCFSVDQDGNPIFVYHARPVYEYGDNGDILSFGPRTSGMRTVVFDIDGTPVLYMTGDRELKEEYREVSINVVVAGEKEPDPASVTVTLDANGGRIDGKSVLTVKEGETADLPIPARAGYAFAGWFDQEGIEYTNKTPITKDVVLTAKWTENAQQPADLSSLEQAIKTAKAAKEGIMVSDKPADQVAAGRKFVTPEAMQALNDAITAAEAAKDTAGTTSEAEAAADELAKAVEAFNKAVRIGTDEEPAAVDTQAIDNAVAEAEAMKKGIMVSDKPADQVEAGTRFVTPEAMQALNDAIAAAEEAKNTAGTTAEAERAAEELNKAVDAFRAAVQIGTYETEAEKKTSTVTLNANGGTVDIETLTVETGTAAPLPVPYRSNYTFIGWFDAQTGGNRYTDTTPITGDVTLYARWTRNSSGSVGKDSGSSRDRDSRSGSTGTSGSSYQWVQERANSDARWKLKRSDGTYVAGSISTDTEGNTVEQVAWAQVNGAWYAFGADGYAKNGWVLDEAAGAWYYVDINSGMKTGWYEDAYDGRYYYLDGASGKMMTGWQKIDGKWYYFNSTPTGKTWEYDQESGSWIYMGNEHRPYGSMYRGEQTPDGYLTDEDGVCKEYEKE